MKSPCENIASAARTAAPSRLSTKINTTPEDPRLDQCRALIGAFAKTVEEDAARLFDQRCRQLCDSLVSILGNDPLSAEPFNLLTLISSETAVAFHAAESVMTSPRRSEPMVVPRQTAMALCRRLTSFSTKIIGEHFGGRDHGTVLHACRATEDRLATDPEFARGFKELEKKLQKAIGPYHPITNPQSAISNLKSKIPQV
jgi:hypothetical protein